MGRVSGHELAGEIVEWIGRLGAAGVSHAKARFGVGMDCAYKHMAALARDGLLVQDRLLYRRPALYVATERGLRWRGLSGLGVCTVSAATFEHSWQLAEAAGALTADLPGWEVLSEREIVWRERERGKLLASVRVGTSGGSARRLHRPDLVLLSPAGRVAAIEVELTRKEGPRLVAICNGWARARHVEAVYYLATAKPALAVGRAVRKTRAEDRITVLPLSETAEVARLELEAAEGGGDGASFHSG